jgi:hypothetical protein
MEKERSERNTLSTVFVSPYKTKPSNASNVFFSPQSKAKGGEGNDTKKANQRNSFSPLLLSPQIQCFQSKVVLPAHTAIRHKLKPSRICRFIMFELDLPSPSIPAFEFDDKRCLFFINSFQFF